MLKESKQLEIKETEILRNYFYGQEAGRSLPSCKQIFFFNVRQIIIQREEPTAQKSKPRARIIHSQEAELGIMKGLVACA